MTLTSPFVLAAGHYFFGPQVQVSGPSTANFFWLSAPHPGGRPWNALPSQTSRPLAEVARSGPVGQRGAYVVRDWAGTRSFSFSRLYEDCAVVVVVVVADATVVLSALIGG